MTAGRCHLSLRITYYTIHFGKALPAATSHYYLPLTIYYTTCYGCSAESRSSQISAQLVQISSFQISLSSIQITEAQLVEIVQDSLCSGRVPPACEAYQKGKPSTGNRRALATGLYAIDLAKVMADADPMQPNGNAAALAIYNGVIARDATASVTATATTVSTDAQVLILPPPHHLPLPYTPTHNPTPHSYPRPPPPPCPQRPCPRPNAGAHHASGRQRPG